MSGGPSTSTTQPDASAAGWGISPSREPRTASIFGAWSWLGIAQHAAQLAAKVADRDDHPAALPTAPKLEESVARPHPPLLGAHKPRRPTQSHQPLLRLRELLLIDSQQRPSGGCCVTGRRPVMAAGRNGPPRGSTRATAARGQAVGDLQLERLARAQATCERRVIRTALGAAPPAVPRPALDIHRARGIAVATRVRIQVREAGNRSLLLRPTGQLDPERRVEAADVRAGQRAVHNLLPASTSSWWSSRAHGRRPSVAESGWWLELIEDVLDRDRGGNLRDERL